MTALTVTAAALGQATLSLHMLPRNIKQSLSAHADLTLNTYR